MSTERYTQKAKLYLTGILLFGTFSLFLLYSDYKSVFLHWYFHHALTALANHDAGEAQDESAKAIGMAKTYPYPYLLQGAIQTGSGDRDGARATYEKMLEQGATSDSLALAYAYLGLAAADLGHYDQKNQDASALADAASHLQKAQSYGSSLPEVPILYGQLSLRQDQWSESKTYFEQAQSLLDQGGSPPPVQSTLFDLYTGLGQVLFHEEKYSEAQINFQRAYALEPSRKTLYAWSILSQAKALQKGQTNQADLKLQKETPSSHPFEEKISTLERFRSEDPQHASFFQNVKYELELAFSATYLKTSRFDDALRVLESAMSLQPLSPDAYRQAVQTLEKEVEQSSSSKQNEWKEKESQARQYLQRLMNAPGDLQEKATALNNIALALQNDSWLDSMAIPLLEKAVELDGTNAILYYNLGWLYQKEGEPGKAKAMFEKSIEKDPDQPQLRKFLGK